MKDVIHKAWHMYICLHLITDFHCESIYLYSAMIQKPKCQIQFISVKAKAKIKAWLLVVGANAAFPNQKLKILLTCTPESYVKASVQ